MARNVMSKKRRVRFAPGPLSERYHTEDGHPEHEGQKAIQRRDLNSPWPAELTVHNVKMLEIEIGDTCQQSIQRLKRRVGLLPPSKRDLHYKTANSPSAIDPNAKITLRPVYSKQRSSKQPNSQSHPAKECEQQPVLKAACEQIHSAASQDSLEVCAKQATSKMQSFDKPQTCRTVQITKVYHRAKRRPLQVADAKFEGKKQAFEDTSKQPCSQVSLLPVQDSSVSCLPADALHSLTVASPPCSSSEAQKFVTRRQSSRNKQPKY